MDMDMFVELLQKKRKLLGPKGIEMTQAASDVAVCDMSTLAILKPSGPFDEWRCLGHASVKGIDGAVQPRRWQVRRAMTPRSSEVSFTQPTRPHYRGHTCSNSATPLRPRQEFENVDSAADATERPLPHHHDESRSPDRDVPPRLLPRVPDQMARSVPRH